MESADVPDTAYPRAAVDSPFAAERVAKIEERR